MLEALPINGGETPTARQKDVLDAVLALIVEQGDQFTMTAVARRASCSKETLYKWFGDRDGLLSATVQWQASKVTVAPVDRDRLDLASLAARLQEFAASWLAVISNVRNRCWEGPFEWKGTSSGERGWAETSATQRRICAFAPNPAR